MEFDPHERDPKFVYRTLTSLVVPRPIGWISTRTAEGVDNLAPYSYFNAVSSYPPVVMFSAGRTDDGERKDTPRNAIETGEFAVNLVTESVGERMDRSSVRLPPDESEFDAAGLDAVEATTVDVPRVAEARACFECSLHDVIEIYDNVVVFGEVEHVHVDETLLTDGKPDTRKVDAVGRLGGPYYTAIDIMDLQRQY